MKAAFHTLGCKVNSYESEAVLEEFRTAGFEIVDFAEPADVYVVNSCSVTGMAEHKSRQMLHRARRTNPDAVIVVTGCYAQRDPETLAENADADLVVGNNRKGEIVNIVREYAENKKYHIFVDDLSRCTCYDEQKISSLGENIRCYVKIQDGCNRFCSYCIIPYVRGRSRLRNREDIIDEVKRLASNGYKEVVLTGIDISMYEDLAGLIEDTDAVPGIDRIRLGSLELSVITEDFVRRVSETAHFCPHFHLSLQSGNDEVLKKMNRHYTTSEYAEKVEMLRQMFPLAGITTDVIVGFPGEGDTEFEESLEFVKKMRFSQTHVFKYSRRKGTVADKSPDQVREEIKNVRSELMMAETDRIKKEFEESFMGRVRPVLTEERVMLKNGRAALLGFTPEYVKIAVTGNAGINEIVNVAPEGFAETLEGEILTAKI